ncbi:PIN domain-containing protein [Paraburkholderia guartelaensis]|uniref:PIN domain-containing protein n=1 Tax=Paraburkholderia guartelaensis TaxID=2546446 RepID=A0ABU9SCK7_9BURK
MRTTFVGWYAKSPEQLKALWDTALIVPDTNILLHLLRHSAEVRGQLMDVFERKEASLWIPYQVGIEFQRRRLDVQQHALDAYDRLGTDLTKFVNQAKDGINQYRAHPVIDIERELSTLDVYQSDFQQRIAAAKAQHSAEEFNASFAKVTELFAGKVGAKPSAERIAAIHKEGNDRYAKKIPPGFEDAKKTADGGDKFGDLVIWMEMIEKAKADKRPIIFVTDDGKSDWWHIHRGKKMGPHPALIEEFLAMTEQEFHIYELLQFLRYAAGTGSQIKEASVQKIADSIAAESETETPGSAAERAASQRALQAELHSKETELDGLIKSLIDLPPTQQQAATADEDVKQVLKARIREVTDLVNAIREQLAALEGDSGS